MIQSLLPPNAVKPHLTPAWWLGMAALILIPLDAFYVQLGHWLVEDAAFFFRRRRFLTLYYALEIWRAIPPLVVLAVLLGSGRIRRADIGWVFVSPRKTLKWIALPGSIAAAIGLTATIGVVVYARLGGHPIPIEPTDLKNMNRAFEIFCHMCFLAPLVEELIYRGVLVSALDRLWGEAWAVAGSGAAFMLLHLLYQRPAWWAPFYFLTGMLFAWAYVRSGSLLVPIALHSIGNFAAWVKDWIILEHRQLVEWVLGYA